MSIEIFSKYVVNIIILVFIVISIKPVQASDDDRLVKCVEAHRAYIDQVNSLNKHHGVSVLYAYAGTDNLTKFNYDAYNRLIACPSREFISKVSRGKNLRRNCFIRIFNGSDRQCKNYNNALVIFEYAIKSNKQYLKMQRKNYENTRVFKGSTCSIDCSGHKAGYQWAEKNNINDESECDEDSESFENGCVIYVRENN